MLAAWYPLITDLTNKGLVDASLTCAGTPTFTEGIIGGSLSTHEDCTVPSTIASQIFNNNTISICFWLYVNTATGETITNRRLFGNTSAGANNNRKYAVFQYPTCNDLLLSWMNDASTLNQFYASNVFPSYEWTHFCVTYDNPTIKVYINGVFNTQFEFVSNSSSFAYDTVIIPKTTDDERRLCDYRVYTHCLSPKEVYLISQGLIAHYPLNNEGFGCENLLKESDIRTTSRTLQGITATYEGNGIWRFSGTSTATANGVFSLYGYLSQTEILTETGTYILSAKVSGTVLKNSKFRIQVLRKNANDTETGAYIDEGGESVVFTIDNVLESVRLFFYSASNGETLDGTIQLKLEKGDKATPWIPAVTDSSYTGLGLNSDVVYDTSGFKNNLYKSTIHPEYSSDTPRYNVSMIFNNSNPNYLYLGRQPKLTYSLTFSCWAYCSDWLNIGGTMLGCVQDGGWGLQNTGETNLVCTIATGVSSVSYITQYIPLSYITSGWHFFAITYDGFVSKVYYDGEIYSMSSTYDVRTPIYYSSNTPSSGCFFVCGESSNNASMPDTNHCFNGKISDVRIYAACLNADDILDLYSAPIAITNSGTLLSYSIDE